MTDAAARELEGLARALRAHARTRRRLGTRAVARAAEPAPPLPERPRPPRKAPAAAPAPEPPAEESRQTAAEPRLKSVGLRRPKASGPSAAERVADSEAAAVRERAAACADLEALRAGVAACTACELCRTRTQTVFADGTGRARVMFIGEAPGFHEDEQGVPFVGRAGALLSDIITKGMGLAREDVYIANVLKCRPPDNRDPSESEKRLCTPWLDRQIELLDPGVLIALGRHAACHVLGVQSSMGALRGRVHEVRGRRVVATYHPAYLLRSPGMKKECWKDIQLAMGELGLEGPPRES